MESLTTEHWIALLARHARSLELCTALHACLVEERRYAIGIETARMVETTARKEQLRTQLAAAVETLAAELHAAGFADWNAAQPSVPEPHRVEWQRAAAAWQAAWKEVVDLAQQNQRLLRHSLRHLNQLLRSLKPLFAKQLTYSARGVPIDADPSGAVIEGRF